MTATVRRTALELQTRALKENRQAYLVLELTGGTSEFTPRLRLDGVPGLCGDSQSDDDLLDSQVGERDPPVREPLPATKIVVPSRMRNRDLGRAKPSAIASNDRSNRLSPNAATVASVTALAIVA